MLHVKVIVLLTLFATSVVCQTPARCNYDTRCYNGNGRCQIARANPFIRAPVRSCQECLDLCSQYIASQTGGFGNTGVNPLYRCQTAVYDQALGICDLFAVTGNKFRYPLVASNNRDLFTPKSFGQNCNGGGVVTEAPTTIPTEATCPAGQSPRYLSITDASLDSNLPVESVAGLSREQCIQLCTNNQNPSTNQVIPCRSVSYDRGECLVSMDVLEPRGNGILINSPGSEFLEKYCFPENLVRRCGDTFERWPQRTLVGFAEQVITVRDFDECLSECLNAQSTFGFACSSGMFYYDDDDTGNCILNSENKNTQPDLFDIEELNTVDYFETDCGVRQRFLMRNNKQKPRRSEFKHSSKPLAQRLRDDVPERLDEWTDWSTCSTRTVQRYRFKTCENIDIRQCPSERTNCTMYHIEPNICRCLLDSRGRKKCDVGIKLVTGRGGKMEYKTCNNPV